MKALCVDDEILLLKALERAVSEADCIDEVFAFDDETDALEWAGNHSFDVAFLDVQLHSMDGMELAEKLRELKPELPIIFCTGYQQYALDAFAIHANAYILKPIKKEDVQKELDYIFNNCCKLIVKNRDNVVVTDAKGSILRFKRAKTTELLSLLLSLDGGSIDSEAICLKLWDDNDLMLEKNKAYLRQLFLDLNKALSDADAAEVLVRDARGYSLNMSLIKMQ